MSTSSTENDTPVQLQQKAMQKKFALRHTQSMDYGYLLRRSLHRERRHISTEPSSPVSFSKMELNNLNLPPNKPEFSSRNPHLEPGKSQEMFRMLSEEETCPANEPNEPNVFSAEFFNTQELNDYHQMKNFAQGMMDLALLSANANQLRYIMQIFDSQKVPHIFCVTFLILSLVLQVVVGACLILKSRYDSMRHEGFMHAVKVNNWSVLGIFFVTVCNVLVASFGIPDQPPGPLSN